MITEEAKEWQEVAVDSLFFLDFSELQKQPSVEPIKRNLDTQTWVPPPFRPDSGDRGHDAEAEDEDSTGPTPEMYLPYGTRSAELQVLRDDSDDEKESNQFVQTFRSLFRESMRKRMIDIPDPLPKLPSFERGAESRVAVLYSGGIDSHLIALFAHHFLPPSESIDLINVAFSKSEKEDSWKDFEVPDRKTGRQGLEELKTVAPNRKWNFVEVNVSQSRLLSCVDDLMTLVAPRLSVMDMTIGPALWFASKGQGYILDPDSQTYNSYHSSSRVLFLGNGADEQLGGYGRHRGCFKYGLDRLQSELDCDVSRLWLRNLGRDDRIVSSVGKEARHPFLDEDFVRGINKMPLGEVCDLRKEPGKGDKRLLRLTAFEEGLVVGASRVKRAIQFGSRVAHLTSRKDGHSSFQTFKSS